MMNSVANDKFLDLSKLKAFPDDTTNVRCERNIEICVGKYGKYHCLCQISRSHFQKGGGEAHKNHPKNVAITFEL